MCFRRDQFKDVHNLTEVKFSCGAMAMRSLNLKVEPFEWILFQSALNPADPHTICIREPRKMKKCNCHRWKRLGLYEDKMDGHWLAVFGMRQAI